MTHKVAIILPVYNGGQFVKDMITELYKSTDFPFKLIVVDGFSTDGTKEYFEDIKNNLKTIFNHTNPEIEFYQIPKKGLVNAINFGIQKAGDLDVYLSQADVIHYKLYKMDWLEMFHKIAQNKKVGIVTGLGGWGISGKDFIDGFKWVGTWNCYISRETLNKIGLYDEQFTGGDDIDFTYRVINEGLDVVVCNYWVHHHQLTERNETHSGKQIKKMGALFKKKWKL